ncbi:MAG TPA: PAS domain-containing protein [bacterium]|nr:PAS domain-containing protein [bacterium]
MSRKNAAILSEAEILATLLDSEVMVWMTNERHRCVYVNDAVLRYTGLPLGQMLDLNWLDHVHPDDQDRVRENQELAARDPQNFRQDYRMRSSSGKWRWAVDTALPRYSRQGRFLGYLGLVFDITDQKQAELELRERQKKLESQILEISEREQRRIGRDLHDGLSQRLLALALHCRILESKLKRRGQAERAQAAKVLREVNQAIRHTREISRALAPVALDKDGLKVALRELADWARENFKVLIRLNWSRNLKPPPLDQAVHLYRIVQEAISNAVRHGRAKRITVSLERRPPGFCRLKIEDDGKGFRPKRSAAKGMGIATMKYRADRLNGSFHIGPRRPSGTEARVEYPDPWGDRA